MPPKADLGGMVFWAKQKMSQQSVGTVAHWQDDKGFGFKSTLHLLSVLGGCLGACLAQVYLRHKSQKVSFRRVYYVTVLLNMALLVYLQQQAFFGL